MWAPDGSATVTPFLPDGSPVRRLIGTEREALRSFGHVDVIHDNGIWLPHNHRLAKLAVATGVPRIVSSRGMLEPWALNHKRWKKRLAWWLYQHRDLRSATLLHATASREASHLENLALRRPIIMVPNGVDLRVKLKAEMLNGAERHGQELVATCSAGGPPGGGIKTEKGQKTALFVGRIYPVKGLPLLVEAWAKTRPVGWKLMIVGPDEAGHRGELESMVAHAKLGAEIEFTGGLSGDALRQVYQEADIFILPSHTENFGMVVGEAMAHGLPVITTHGAPWELLETERCGWWVPVSVAGIAAALDDATHRSPEELSAMGERGRAVVAERFAWDGIARQFVECYRWVLGQGPKPGCVE